MVSPVPVKLNLPELKHNTDIVTATLAERGSRYGTFTDNAHVAQYLKTLFRNQRVWNNMQADQMEALDLIALKLSRILTGDPHYADNWVDIAGYAKLVADRIEKK